MADELTEWVMKGRAIAQAAMVEVDKTPLQGPMRCVIAGAVVSEVLFIFYGAMEQVNGKVVADKWLATALESFCINAEDRGGLKVKVTLEQ